MNSEQFNSIYAPTLHVVLMDTIRKQHQSGTEVTTRTLITTLRTRLPNQTPDLLRNLRHRIGRALGDMERGGLITRTYKRKHALNIHYQHITPCSEESAT